MSSNYKPYNDPTEPQHDDLAVDLFESRKAPAKVRDTTNDHLLEPNPYRYEPQRFNVLQLVVIGFVCWLLIAAIFVVHYFLTFGGGR